jgi:hypothetical protein
MLHIYRRFGETYFLHLQVRRENSACLFACWTYSSILKMEELSCFETSVNMYQNTRHHIPENNTLKIISQSVHITPNAGASSQSQSYVITGGQSASLSWNEAPIWGLRPDLYYCQTVAGLLMWGALSDDRTGLSFARVTVSSNKSVVSMYNLLLYY